MLNLSKLAIIGSGPTAIFLLKNIVAHIDVLKGSIESITIFEKEKLLGIGMPFRENTTDIYNLANISSEEIPKLPQSLSDWLRNQEKSLLKAWNITKFPIDDKKVYSRIALGHYFHDQFKELVSVLELNGIKVIARAASKIEDIAVTRNTEVELRDNHGNGHHFTTVVIANGHAWNDDDNIKAGYFAAPWPIHKLFPEKGTYYNFPIATLGASLSAFDVVVSLAQRHGTFVNMGNALKYKIHKEAQGFKLVLHSAEGWLPHLQYEQVKPMREMYRHFSRQQLLDLIDKDGFLHIEDYFDQLCRPVLIRACTKDKQHDIIRKLKDRKFKFKDYVRIRSEMHQYINSFEGMKLEMETAVDSVKNDHPIHWMETLDDLMYSLNYHAELLPAEDQIFLKKEVFTFLMNVIAALPLESAQVLLALYDADCIALKSGRVSVKQVEGDGHKTTIKSELEDGTSETNSYKMFIDCSGQKRINLDTYPFPTLVKSGMVSGATARFSDVKIAETILEENPEDICMNNKTPLFKLPGISIDKNFRIRDKSGTPSDLLFDINFTHTLGLRPYSFGLQACNTTACLVVSFWLSELRNTKKN